MLKITFIISLIILFFNFNFDQLRASLNKPEYLIDFTPDEKFGEVIDRANSEFSFEVMISDVPGNDEFDFEVIEEDDLWKAASAISTFQSVISLYKDEVIDDLVSNVYLVKNLTNKTTQKECNGMYCAKIDSIYLNVNNFSTRAIHHEIFHAISRKKVLPNSFYEKFKGMKDCKSISCYACTSFREELADGWAYSFKTYDKCYKLEAVREELYPLFLK